MGKAARIKAQRTEKFEHEPKRPTGTYRTAKERAEERRKDREKRAQTDAMIQKLAASVMQDVKR